MSGIFDLAAIFVSNWRSTPSATRLSAWARVQINEYIPVITNLVWPNIFHNSNYHSYVSTWLRKKFIRFKQVSPLHSWKLAEIIPSYHILTGEYGLYRRFPTVSPVFPRFISYSVTLRNNAIIHGGKWFCLYFAYVAYTLPIANFDAYTMPIRKKRFSMNAYTNERNTKVIINKSIKVLEGNK